MKAGKTTIDEMERLLSIYQNEVNNRLKDGYLKNSTAKTYLLHADNFVKWCKGDFVPGGKHMPIGR